MRLALAAGSAEGGQVVQFLAGAPELMARYRNAPPTAAALLNAAIDGRRLGMGIAMPLTFLEAAAPGYLTDADWDGLADGWLEQALTYTGAPCKGIRGPLTRVRPRTAGRAAQATAPAYRLADYLDQYGRHTRGRHVPPPEFWRAAARFAGIFPGQPDPAGRLYRDQDALPGWLETYMAMEEAAWSIRAYEPGIIPGLLQTEAYSAAVMPLGDCATKQAGRLGALRKERQNRFRSGDLNVWAILDEAALRRPVAGTRIQLEQLRYLRATGSRTTVTLQILPHGAACLAPRTGFSILRFPQRDLPDAVYAENLASALYTEDQNEADPYVAAMDQMAGVAYEPDETLQVLDGIIAGLEKETE